MLNRILLLLSLILSATTGCARGDRIMHEFTFDAPMSWADDIAPWGLGGVQEWAIADGGRPGKALRISAKAYEQPVSYEVRTLQFNHKPGTRARISFDIRPACAPAGTRFAVQYFDGYCGAFPFINIADDKFAPFPEPIFVSEAPDGSDEWRHVEIETKLLANTVLTLAFVVQQAPDPDENTATADGGEQRYIEYFLDNLRIKTVLLDKQMDPGFDWHGNGGSNTIEFRHNVRAADADWCDFIDQEDVRAPGGVIHYRLLPMRSSSTYPDPGWNYRIAHDASAIDIGGHSVIALRGGADRGCAVSWGVRQTVSYNALGLRGGQEARVRVSMKMTNYDPQLHRISRVQLGVDPNGGVITRNATWTEENNVNCYKEGWHTAELEFDRPADAKAFTIYFRRRDGIPEAPREPWPFPEPQSQGTPGGNAAGIADWVMVEVIEQRGS